MIEQKKAPALTIEIIFLASVILLVGIGFGFLYSASQPSGIKYYDNAYYYIIKQGIYLGIGCLLFFIGFFVNYQIYHRHIKLISLITLILLILTLVPGIGKEIGGARRWLEIYQLQFQPSEIAKLVLVFYLSTVLVNKEEFIKDFYKGVLPPLIFISFLSFLIFMENDFSTTFIMIFVSFVMFFLAGIRILTFSMLGIIGGLSGLTMIFFAPYRIKRLFAFFNPWLDPLGSGWHYLQSMKCFALGKWFGKGIGESIQKNFALPEAHNDYIFAIIAEEGGLIIAVIVLMLYTIIAFTGFNIAKRIEDKHAFLLISGITFLIYFQAIVNIGVVIGILPSTGNTLPFISAGGTSLVVFLYAVGVLLNASRKNRQNRGVRNNPAVSIEIRNHDSVF